MNKKWLQFGINLLLILFGTNMYAFGLVAFNMANRLAEGGVTGISLIFLNLFGINPAYTTFLINIPLILFGSRILGKKAFVYTIWGTVTLSAALWVWQRVPLNISVEHDLLIAALLAGFFGGLGSGIVYRAGGTTGGADIIARILEKKSGVSMGRSLLALDVVVLVASLTYIDLQHMMYTLIVSFVFSNIVDFVQDGSYKAKGVLIVSRFSEEIGNHLMSSLERGISYLDGQGGYSQAEQKIIYIVVSPKELQEVRRIVEDIDETAFLSVINVHDVIGEGFTFKKPPRKHVPWVKKF